MTPTGTLSSSHLVKELRDWANLLESEHYDFCGLVFEACNYIEALKTERDEYRHSRNKVQDRLDSVRNEIDSLNEEKEAMAETLGNKAKEWALSFEERSKIQAEKDDFERKGKELCILAGNAMLERDDYREVLEKIKLEPPGCDSAWFAKEILTKYPKEHK